MFKKFTDAVKKKPLLILGAIAAGAIVIYLVYQNQNKAQGTAGAQTGGGASAPNQMNPYGQQSSQLGGYLMLEEDVINPSPVNVTINKPAYGSHEHSLSKVSRSSGKSYASPPSHPSKEHANKGAASGGWGLLTKNGVTYHTWKGADGRLWGNTGPNTPQVLLKGHLSNVIPVFKNKQLGTPGPGKGEHITQIVSPLTHATPPGHNMVPLGLKQTIPSYKGRR